MLALLGPWDFVIIAVIIVLLFGSRRIGHAIRALGAGGREFKRGIRGEQSKLPPPEPK